MKLVEMALGPAPAWKAITLVWMAGVLAAALLPLPLTFGIGGTPWHVIAFAVTALLLSSWQSITRTIMLAWTYGTLVEGLQALVPYRSVSLTDLAVNAAGVMAGIGARYLALKWYQRE